MNHAIAPPRRLLRPGQVARILPLEARSALREASEIEPYVLRGESRKRDEAIADVTAAVKRAYPEYFRQEVAAPVL